MTRMDPNWPPGPWDNEPDRAVWRYHGLHCVALRNTWGAWCGYVGIPPGHPWNDQSPDEVGEVECTGTMARSVSLDLSPTIPAPASWWGFDCGHHRDLTPTNARLLSIYERTYRDLPQVRAWCHKVADQLLEANPCAWA